MKKMIFILFGLFLVSACKEEIHTVDKFMKDDNLRKSFLVKCDNGELHNQELNCQNSRKAEQNKVMLSGVTEHGTKL